MMQQVSLQAYQKVKNRLRNSYQKILLALVENNKPMSNNDLAKYLQTFPNKISGRTGEMFKMGWLYVPRKKMNNNGNMERLFWFNWSHPVMSDYMRRI